MERSGVSPESTSTSSASPTASRAERTASPVPSGSCWTATSRPVKASAVEGDATTTSGSAPSGRAASTTQSTMRRPRIGCRCLTSEERMRVPSPPAMTTAASLVGIVGVVSMAGAPGFEPGITGPKPVALPLGHAPEQGRQSTRRPRAVRGLPPVEEERAERDDREQHDGERRHHDERSGGERHDDDEQLRDGCRPGDDPDVRMLVLPPPRRVHRERRESEQDDEPPRDRAREDEDPLDRGDRRVRP